MKQRSNNSKRVGLALLLAAVFSLSALQGYSSNYTKRTPSIQAGPVVPQTDGLDVTPVLDTGRAVTQLIKKEGGTIAATGADGTRFMLVFPPDSLFEEEVITMTPVISVTGLPFSRGLAAVQLAPDGLVLKHPADLIFDSMAPAPADEEAPCAWNGTGLDFHLYPLKADHSRTVMPLIHFSGYGLARGIASEIFAQQQRSPRSFRSILEQGAQKLTGDERSRQAQTGDASKKQQKKFSKKVADTTVDTIENISILLESALQSSETTALRCVLSKALYLETNLELIFKLTRVNESDQLKVVQRLDRVLNLIETVMETLRDRAYQRCGDGVNTAVLLLIGLARDASALAVKHPHFAPLASDIQKKAQECAQFELEFNSLVESFTQYSTTSAQVKATVPLQLEVGDSNSFRVRGDAPMIYVKFVYRLESPCSARAEGSTASNLVVSNLVLNLELDEPCGEGPGDPNKLPAMSMNIIPGRTFERVSLACPGGGVSDHEFPAPGLWGSLFAFVHGKQPGEEIVIKDWKRGGGDVVAVSNTPLRRDAEDGTIITENSTYTLRHKR